MVMPSAVLAGIGSWLPSRRLDNEELAKYVGKSPEWLLSRSGVRSRRIVEGDTCTGDLAVNAGKAALESAGVTKVSTVVLATTSPDRSCPGTAPSVASRLGLDCAAMDVQAVCAGFIYALSVAQGLIATETADSVLVIGADTMSPFLDPVDPKTRLLFGDGAGAFILRRGDSGESGAIGPTILGSDGSGRDLITVRSGGSEERLTEKPMDPFMRMEGRKIFQRAVTQMGTASRQALKAAGWELEDVDRIATHQANARITTMLGEQLGIDPCRLLSNIDEVGNTSAASIPLLLDHSHRSGLLMPGDRLLLAAFGAGLVWGATTMVWPDIS